MSSFPTCQLPIIVAAVLLSPVFAFVMAIAVEILIGSLIEASVPAPLAVFVGGAIGWSLFHKLKARPSPAESPMSALSDPRYDTEYHMKIGASARKATT
jgi:hypothetical protein